MTDLPLFKFPRLVALTGQSHAFTGDIGGVKFVEGRAVGFVPYHKIASISAGYGPLEDLATGETLSPLREGRFYEVDWNSRFWREHMPLPDWCADLEAQAAGRLAGTNEGTTDADGQEEGRKEEVIPADPLPLVVQAIGLLDRDNGDHWTSDGKPSATRLSSLVSLTVTSELRDQAWAEWQRANTPVSDVLEKVLERRGARFLRQIAADKGLPTPRAGADLVKVLAGALSVEDALSLA